MSLRENLNTSNENSKESIRILSACNFIWCKYYLEDYNACFIAANVCEEFKHDPTSKYCEINTVWRGNCTHKPVYIFSTPVQ